LPISLAEDGHGPRGARGLQLSLQLLCRGDDLRLHAIEQLDGVRLRERERAHLDDVAAVLYVRALRRRPALPRRGRFERVRVAGEIGRSYGSRPTATCDD